MGENMDIWAEIGKGKTDSERLLERKSDIGR